MNKLNGTIETKKSINSEIKSQSNRLVGQPIDKQQVSKLDGTIVKENFINGTIQDKTKSLKGQHTLFKGIKNYTGLPDKPKINGVELVGNMTSKELLIQDEMDLITNEEIEEMFKEGN